MTKNTNVCTVCIKKTGGCCSEVDLTVHVEEIAPFKARFDDKSAPEGHTLEPFNEEDDVFMYSSKEDPCMFLEEKGKCSIYDARPLICRLYPVLWQDNRKEENNYFIDFACPLAHMYPTRKFKLWTEKENNSRQVKMMGELDFDLKSSQYVNLTVITEEVSPAELLDPEYKP